MNTVDTKDAVSNSEKQALAQYESIANMIAAYDFANNYIETDLTDEDVVAELDEEDRDELKRLLEETDFSAKDLSDPETIQKRIMEDPLSVEVRSDWHTIGDVEGQQPSEYKILLCTGGPAVRIIGDLDAGGTPSRARLEHQDWFTPWTEVINGVAQSTLVQYASFFYYSV